MIVSNSHMVLMLKIKMLVVLVMMMMSMRMPSKCVLGEGEAVPIFGEICSSRPLTLLCCSPPSPSAVLCNLRGLV